MIKTLAEKKKYIIKKKKKKWAEQSIKALLIQYTL